MAEPGKRCPYSDYRALAEHSRNARTGWGNSRMTSGMPSSGSRGQGLVAASDGLPALAVSEHVREKEFAIEGMISIFNNGMQNKWNRRYYIDLFAGPGRCVIKGSGEEVDGSPILAAKSKVKFTDYFLADNSSVSIEALKKRIDGLGSKELAIFNYYLGDADAVVDELAVNLPEGRTSLGLAVLDPWGWDFSFKALAKLSQGRRLDLVINFPVLPMIRNQGRELPGLDRFMNGSNYKESLDYAMKHENPNVTSTRVLLDFYENELKGIGYKYINDQVEVENSVRRPQYHLIFASKHERGSEFWDKVTNRQETGQMRLEF